MGKRDDLRAAFEHRQPDGAVPIWEISFQAWDAVSGQHLVLGQEFQRLSSGEQERALRRNAEIILTVCEEMHFAALTCPQGYWYQAPGQLAYYVLPGESVYRQFEIIRQLADEDLVLVGNSGGVIAADYGEEFCEALFLQPERIDDQARQTLQRGLETAKRYRDLGAGAVVTSSDVADNSGPFFSPPQMQRFILPYLREWASAVKALGLFSILHSDGNLAPYLEMLASTPLDALQAIDPVAGMDIVATKRAVGDRLCLCGNVDCGLLLTGRPEEVFAATRKLLEECKAGGGLVLGASNAVQQEVPPANYRAMIEAWRLHGQY